MNMISAAQSRSLPVLRRLHRVYSLLALTLASHAAFGVPVYDEGTNGDFSGAGTSPTSLGALGLGANEVHGVTGRNASGTRDIDYFSFSVPAGYQLSEIRLLAAAPGSTGFAGIQAGGQITLPPNAASAAGLLGWVHYKDTQIGTDVLDDIGSSGGGATGFTPPLGAGTYALWVQDGNPGPLPYGFNFVVRPVPDFGFSLNEFGLAILAAAACLGVPRLRKTPWLRCSG